ncbi:MAG: formyltetrahydrofolate deformylase [Acidimicrobiales bacterium]
MPDANPQSHTQVDSFVLTLACPDRLGIVHAVSGLLAGHGYNIVESKQFGDPQTGRFFMRVQVETVTPLTTMVQLRRELGDLGHRFAMEWGWHDSRVRPSLLVLVSRFGHCLNDLLYRYSVGALRVHIPAVVSNHPDFADLVRSYGIAFYHLPVTPESRSVQETRILALADEHGADLVVLARYMQILTSETAAKLSGRAINIHHGLLPSFKGANPYKQAYERGVKVIGATAHYVTEQLDEGPIIEQIVQPVDHAMSPADLAVVGRDIECQALGRAVTWHVEHRVFLNSGRTVVFR